MKVFDITNNFKEIKETLQLGMNHYWILTKADELRKLRNFILLDEESIEECNKFAQPSKISFFDGYIFMNLNVLNYCNEIINSKELNIFLSKDYIITVFKEDIDIIEEFIEDIKDSKNCFVIKEKPKVCILLYYILDRIIVKNYDIIAALEAQVDEIEISILKEPKHEQIDNLINLRRQVYKIRKYLNPLRYIGDSLVSNDNMVLEKENIIYFINLNRKIDKLMMALESLVQDLALVREAFESEIANKTNELMKVFTIIATIFLPLNLITSMHGMNMKGIPFEKMENGYHCMAGIMLIIALILVGIFKKKKWL
ncbi:magnesium transporter CorA family protein [Clostridium scatologenes]|uniref:Putative magnesium and cobalt transport protein CorA n=1 Tax=Clostridium scatologenes TaxID=1548 RepID=A0A0E3M8R4_CLOSL|nr:magnesium transporter CorA family protein [Clostridium scatologenes]AKA68607.1 putative magnesium and cobalt transport protein CorA [Clostridium scatologenes]